MSKYLEMRRQRGVPDFQFARYVAGANEILIAKKLQDAPTIVIRQCIEYSFFVISRHDEMLAVAQTIA